jgi:hypothetical protein
MQINRFLLSFFIGAWQTPKSVPSSFMELLILLIAFGFFLVFPLFWIMVVWLISRFGWAALAADYQTTQPPTGSNHTLVSARIGLSNYNGTLNIWLNESGIFLEPIWLFRVGHARLFLPWQAVGSLKSKPLLWYTGAHLVMNNGYSITLYGKFAQELLARFEQT